MDKYSLRDYEQIIALKTEIFRVDLNFLDLGDLEDIQEYEVDLGLDILTYYDLGDVCNSDYETVDKIYNQWCKEIIDEFNKAEKSIKELLKNTC